MPPGIFTGIASSGRPVDIRWSLSLAGLVSNVPVGMNSTWMLEVGLDRARNREVLAEKALQAGARYLFFLDDDTVCPNITFKYLIYEMEKDPKIMVAGGIYCTKEALPSPLVFKKIGDGSFWKWKVGEVFDCEGLGTGCMMIKTEVFEHLPKPWFLEPHETPQGEAQDIGGEKVPVSHRSGTEDLYFCQKVINAGFRIVAHGGILPLHIDQRGIVYGLPQDSYPMQKELPLRNDLSGADGQTPENMPDAVRKAVPKLPEGMQMARSGNAPNGAVCQQ